MDALPGELHPKLHPCPYKTEGVFKIRLIGSPDLIIVCKSASFSLPSYFGCAEYSLLAIKVLTWRSQPVQLLQGGLKHTDLRNPKPSLYDASGKPANRRCIAVLIHSIPHFPCNCPDSLKVVRAGSWEAGFDDVHSQLCKLFCNFQLLFAGKRGTW